MPYKLYNIMYVHSFDSFDCLVLVCLLMENGPCSKHPVDVVQLLGIDIKLL